VIVGATTDCNKVIGENGGGPGLGISGGMRILENPSPIKDLRVWRETSVMQNIPRSNFVRALIYTYTVYRMRIVDLVKLSLDSNVVPEIVRGIEAISFEVVRPVVRICQVEHSANLQISSARSGRRGLAVKPRDRKAQKADQRENFYSH
jgi:hypothetical protein